MNPNKEYQGTNDYDIVIVGAGISGINGAYRVQTELPGSSYTILEGRADMGGTWDLFRYPGIRSDSDLHTFGFAFRPWLEQRAIADGESILNYVKETAETYGIDKHIQYNHRLVSASWSSDEQLYTLEVMVNGEKKIMHCHFLMFGSGYYDYKEPLPAVIPGLENFKGTIVHPQFWSHDLEYVDKKIVIVGSGATAVTLLPNLAEKASHVTMLQRSPGYIVSRPTSDRLGLRLRKYLPSWLVHKVLRAKFLVLSWFFYNFCKAYPEKAREQLRKRTQKVLPDNVAEDPHFMPKYNPWDQRMCVCPDGDFYKSLGSGRSSVETDTIKTVTEQGILLNSGKQLFADIIITATGLNMVFAGNTKFFVDGEPLKPADKFLWKGVMLQDLPNASFLMGYPNASYTLGADAASLLTCRLIKRLKKTGETSAIPTVAPGENLETCQALGLTSTYVTRALHKMPKSGDKGPWKGRGSYFSDMWNVKFGSLLDGMKTYKISV